MKKMSEPPMISRSETIPTPNNISADPLGAIVGVGVAVAAAPFAIMVRVQLPVVLTPLPLSVSNEVAWKVPADV